MLQGFEGYYFPLSFVFVFFGLFAFGWLIIHIEHGRHFSKFKVGASLVLGALLLGFGIHFLLLSAGL